MAASTTIDFATEVKTDRLSLLWKLTLGACVTLMMITVTLSTFNPINVTAWLVAPAVFGVGCLLTRFLLTRGGYAQAAWSYSLSAVAAVGVGIYTPDLSIIQTFPFAFALIVFVSGLLLRPLSALVVAVISMVVTLAAPYLATGSFAFLSGHQAFAIILMYMAAGLAAQVTGELYAVTEWAMLNYQRERRTNNDLFESRQKLEQTLRRSEALSDKLQTTNVELESARQAAEAAKHFRGQFLANMSHELRTPLNAIIGFSETMLKFPLMYDNVELPEAYQGDLTQIYSSGKQLLTLINDILDLAKVDAGKLEIHTDVVDLEPIIAATLATAQGLVGLKPVELRKDVPSTLPKVIADPHRVRQVLLNLYSNAVKFTDHGSITLSLRETHEGVLIGVKDTGSGIPKESLQIIFEEFRQADNSRRDPRSGSGLGLAISRQLITLMGGRIWAESEHGEGSTVYFTLKPFVKAHETAETDLVSAAQEIAQ